MIVFLCNPFGEQLRVQLGSEVMALVVEHAINSGWAIHGLVKPAGS